MTNFKITADQAKKIVNDDGSLDYTELGKIMSEKETAAAQAKEKEIAGNQANPNGGKCRRRYKNRCRKNSRINREDLIRFQ